MDDLPWSVRHPAANIHVVDFAAEDAEWDQWVLLSGDRHHDNPHTDHDLELQHLDEAVRRRAAILDVGDLFCAMGGKADPRASKHGVTREEHAMANDYFDSLVRHAAEFYSPYAKHFIAIGRGNHESSVLKRQETDLTTRLCERMSTMTGHHVQAGGYGGWVQFRVTIGMNKRTALSLKYFHGSGGGGLMTFDTLRVRRQASYLPDADVIVCGHVHESWWMKIGRERLVSQNGVYRTVLESQHHVRTGTYKDEYGSGAGGWHIEKGGPPKCLGAVWMRLYLERRGMNAKGGGQMPRLCCEFTPAQ